MSDDSDHALGRELCLLDQRLAPRCERFSLALGLFSRNGNRNLKTRLVRVRAISDRRVNPGIGLSGPPVRPH